jgi:hypothetical protein
MNFAFFTYLKKHIVVFVFIYGMCLIREKQKFGKNKQTTSSSFKNNMNQHSI